MEVLSLHRRLRWRDITSQHSDILQWSNIFCDFWLCFWCVVDHQSLLNWMAVSLWLILGCFMSEIEQNVRKLLFFDICNQCKTSICFFSLIVAVFNRSVVTGFWVSVLSHLVLFLLMIHCNSSDSSNVLQQKWYICVWRILITQVVSISQRWWRYS